MRKRYLKIVGIIGLDLIFLGILLAWILTEYIIVARIFLIAGLVLIFIWSISSWKIIKTFIGKGTLGSGTRAILSSIFLIGILIIINILGAKYKYRIDSTAENLFTLSDGTKKILANLDEKVKILLFDNPDAPINQDAVDIIIEYDQFSPHIDYEIIDPDRNPQLSNKYNVTEYGQAVIIYNERSKTISAPDEEKLTATIKQIVWGGGKKVYFLVGHREFSPFSKKAQGLSIFAQSITYEGLDFDTLNLFATSDIPDDAGMIVIIGPKTNPLSGELDMLSSYFENGGKLLVMLNPGQSDSLAKFLTRYGVRIHNNMIFDLSSQGSMFGLGPEMPIIRAYESRHPITAEFNLLTMMPTLCTVSKIQGLQTPFEYTELARSSEKSWADIDWQTEKAVFDPRKDIPGPLTIACAIQYPNRKDSPRMVVIGDADFVTNEYIDFMGNKDFALNIVNWLTEQEKMISIRPKNPKNRQLLLTPEQENRILYISILALPFLALIFAEIAWWLKQRE
ncbi:hypothetical protein DRQ33_00335 [bacterium]|nr:MAG: hypothetical protein DRQ33_00335 [bacterium]